MEKTPIQITKKFHRILKREIFKHPECKTLEDLIRLYRRRSREYEAMKNAD